MRIDVAFLPAEVKEYDLSGKVCVVLDIFRATTSIVTAIANGCQTIIPVASTEDAFKAAETIDAALFAGERQSIRIEGFDLGNSPYEFSAEKVLNRIIIMTTTNGTIAIKATTGAYRTLIGSFINARAVCQQAQQYGKDILIVCAGTDRLFSLEDALCAGLLVRLLQEGAKEEAILNDAAYGALLMYGQVREAIAEMAVNSRNGERLRKLGCMKDVEYCLQTDVVHVVPEYSEGRIMANSPSPGR